MSKGLVNPTCPRTALFVFAALFGVVADAQVISTGSSQISAGSELRQEMHRLVRQDARKVTPKPVTSDQSPPSKTDEVVVLERLDVVGEKQLPEFRRPRETKLAQVLRTGTIAEHVGKKTTLRLWMSGDAGLVLTLSW